MANTTIARKTLEAYGTHAQQYAEWEQQRDATIHEWLNFLVALYTQTSKTVDARAATLNARAAYLQSMDGAVDASEGPMNPEHLQYGH